MNDKESIMIAIGVAMGANCIPCLEHLYEKGETAGVNESEIKQISAIADRVKNGAAVFMKNTVHKIIGLPVPWQRWKFCLGMMISQGLLRR